MLARAWWGVWGFSQVVATFNHVGRSFNLYMATTRDVSIIPSFRICNFYVLHVEHISCVITNCGRHQWVIPSPLLIALLALLEENTTRKLLYLSSWDLFFKILLFQVAFLIFSSVAILPSYFLLVSLLLYPPHNEVVGGVYLFHSVHPSVCSSRVRPASRVRSVASTVLVWSISYLCILESNFRRCVTCKVSCQISKFEILAIF